MRELKESLKLMFGFLPWILFMFIAGDSFASLKRAILICLILTLLTGFKGLRQGLWLAWGNLAFFAIATVLVNGLSLVWMARNMGWMANGFLAAFMWITLAAGSPFTLQYARLGLPRERWEDPQVLNTCQRIAMIWALLMLVTTASAGFARIHPHLHSKTFYMGLSLSCMLTGVALTAFLKRNSQRA